DTAIFTNLTHDHLDFHGTMEEYGHAKGLLFSQLGQDLTQNKRAVLNADDEWSEKYAAMTPFPVYTYGVENEAMFRASNIELKAQGTSCALVCPQGEFPVAMNLLGHFNVYNALAAIAALSAEGYPLERVIAALEAISPVEGRMQKVDIDAPVS